MDIGLRHEWIPLDKRFVSHEDQYPRYDNYNAIECSRIRDIPCDYSGIMGVPITLFEHLNHEQFEILGLACGWTGKEMNDDWKNMVGYTNIRSKYGSNGYGIIGDRQVYHRVLVRNRLLSERSGKTL